MPETTDNYTAMKNSNNQAIGTLRLCLTLAVVLHHSVLAYCTFGHFDHQHYLLSTAPIIDRERWSGFDLLVRWNDTYFMALMFFISGIFVLPSLQRKGSSRYLKHRLLRLGLPFIACVTVIMPVAYYPSILEAGQHISFVSFWLGYFGRFHWPGGPAWFLWYLLLLDALCVLIIRFFSCLSKQLSIVPDFINRHFFAAILVVMTAACVAYLPLAYGFGPDCWLNFGPFFIQGSRIALYAFFFALGCAAGVTGIHHTLFQRGSALARYWVLSFCFGGLSFGFFLVPSLTTLGLQPLFFVFCCVSFCMALTGLCLCYVTTVPACVERFMGDAYGVYLLHYAFVTWSQFYVLPLAWRAVPKAAFVLAVTLSCSIFMTRTVRHAPAMRRVI
ncbi:MAG: acyltransferase [Acetobacter persici]